MPSAETLSAFIAKVVAGEFVEAIEGFYHDDSSMQENQGVMRSGLPQLVAGERQALARMEIRAHPPLAVLADGDGVAIRWRFDLTDKEGVTRRLDEIALQEWRGDRIAREQFFYHPDLPVLEG
jgi:hypothetical protein